MDFLKLFAKPSASPLLRLPSGSFTIDPEGRVITSTLPQWFPSTRIQEIGEVILNFFREARSAQMPLLEVIVYFSALKMTARELRGGAIVFLTPQPLLKS